MTNIPFDNPNEVLPLVDEQGQVVGKALRGECHDGTKKLHPVVHLHVFDAEGRLYLQHRPIWKKIQPNRWDTAVGGHIGYGETVAEALEREAYEELGLSGFEAASMEQYVYESTCEREFVHVFCTRTAVAPTPSAELDGGAFFTHEEIVEQLGKGFFTPMFEAEWQQLSQLECFRRYECGE